jgi:hypothetical protein
MLNLKVPITILSLLIFTSISWAQKDSCDNFHTGKYFYTPPNGGEVHFKRTKKKQIERYNNENQRFIFSITWTSSCTYTLRLIKTKGVNRKIKKEIIGTEMFCEIESTELSHYNINIIENDGTTHKELTVYLK